MTFTYFLERYVGPLYYKRDNAYTRGIMYLSLINVTCPDNFAYA